MENKETSVCTGISAGTVMAEDGLTRVAFLLILDLAISVIATI